jgi:hypothetical protein
MTDTIFIDNKVAKSGLVTVDLEKIAGKRVFFAFDLKEFLFMELMLREKDFRQAMESHDWSRYNDGVVSVFCSTDAIIASWAYMLVASNLKNHAAAVYFSDPVSTKDSYFKDAIQQHDWSQYAGKRILLKGCSDESIPQSVYGYATLCAMPHAERLMYGEACSFVPVWRTPKL